MEVHAGDQKGHLSIKITHTKQNNGFRMKNYSSDDLIRFFLSLHFRRNTLFAVGNFLSLLTQIHLLFDQRCVTSLDEGVFVLSGVFGVWPV